MRTEHYRTKYRSKSSPRLADGPLHVEYANGDSSDSDCLNDMPCSSKRHVVRKNWKPRIRSQSSHDFACQTYEGDINETF